MSQAEAPLDGAADDEGDDGHAVGNGGDDDFKGVDFGDVLDAAESEGGHGEQAGSGAKVADVIGDGEQGEKQGHERNGLLVLGVGDVVVHAAANHL